MKYKIEIATNSEGITIYWILCGAFVVGKFTTQQAAEQWIQNNPDWDCNNCYNCR